MERENKVLAEGRRFSCINCGAEMHYFPDKKALFCPFCNSEEEVEEVIPSEGINEYILDGDIDDDLENLDEEPNLLLHCKSCSAEINIGPDEKSAFCPFCGSSHILKEEDNKRKIKPETIIPFRITKDVANKKFKKWIRGKIFAPSDLKNSKTENLSGVYIPYWTYDSDTYTEYLAERGDYYYETHTRTDSEGKEVREQVRKTRWRRVNGILERYYNDTMVTASKNHKEGLLDKTDNFNLSNLIKYDPRFLSGFMSERYSIGVMDGWIKAEKIIENLIYSDIRKQVGGDEFRLINRNTKHKEIYYKQFLLPMWVSNYNYKGKIYEYLINGENGKIYGEYPKSFWKIFLSITFLVFIFFIIAKHYNQI
jgi:predicted RNA-binding Zn-ribbon protein involved in translation (DUF1610 family)